MVGLHPFVCAHCAWEFWLVFPADKYRQTAYVSEPEKQNLDTYLAELEVNRK